VDKQRLTERISYHMGVAKKDLAGRSQVGAEDQFVQTAILVHPEGYEQEVPLAFYDYCEQQECMRRLSEKCVELGVSALIIRARALLLSTSQIKKELKIDECDRDGYRSAIARWIQEMARDGRVVSLPPRFQKWCLLVFGLGPRLPSLGLVQYYIRTGKETNFIADPILSLGFEFPLIRKWWQ
jgi:hypothetical protein